MISATLTPNQNRLVVLLLEIGNQAEAYRRTYDCSGMSAKTIRNRASEEFQKPHEAARLAARRRAQEGAQALGANRPTARAVPSPRCVMYGRDADAPTKSRGISWRGSSRRLRARPVRVRGAHCG